LPEHQSFIERRKNLSKFLPLLWFIFRIQTNPMAYNNKGCFSKSNIKVFAHLVKRIQPFSYVKIPMVHRNSLLKLANVNIFPHS
jgi:hypothetical protein